MKLYRLRAKQRLPIGLEQAWEFFSHAGNLPSITPPSLGFEVLSEVPERMYAGMIAAYRVRPFPGVRTTWVTEITHVCEPYLFVDEQRFGPYRFWHHEHHFRAVDGGVELEDIVHYAPPPVVAALANAIVIAPQLRRIFRYRHGVLESRFGRLR